MAGYMFTEQVINLVPHMNGFVVVLQYFCFISQKVSRWSVEDVCESRRYLGYDFLDIPKTASDASLHLNRLQWNCTMVLALKLY